MGKVNWNSSSSEAMLVGTIESILGAFAATLYNGPPILRSPSAAPPVQPRGLLFLLSRPSNWILGRFLLAAEAFFVSFWHIIQAFIIKGYPVVLNIMFYVMFFLTIFSRLVSLVTVRTTVMDSESPRGLDGPFYTRVTLSTWCLKRTVPVYVSMFQPLGILFAVAVGFIFLGETLHLGLMGAIVIVMGFYVVVWGKSKEEEKKIEGGGVWGSLASFSHNILLLQNQTSGV